ncbi:MAG TPA: hypothetical protein DCY58_06905 [Acetobacterium sp.]|jgi:ABC-type molybdate transport system ATPase subunit|nr:MAG: hypothetical protein BI182_02890 [Acetobacterium sp. MES1]HAZ06020.1 hypothetical protein [Acetobacterium sp.]
MKKSCVNMKGNKQMKMSKEDKIRILIDALDAVMVIPNHIEESVRDALRNALRTIEKQEEAND